MARSGPAARRIDPGRLAARRSAAQLLHRPAGARHPADVARAICGAQAQDAAAGRLHFRARARRLRAADVDRARGEERSLVRTWAMRGTMHLIASEDFGWLVPLFEPGFAANSRRRLGQLGMDAATVERGLREIERALAPGEPVIRDEMAERLARRGIELDPSTRLHLVRLAVATGVAVLGPDAGRRSTLVAEREWLGERPPHDRGPALAELARRYLRAFGPATEADFAGWAGLPFRDVRAGLEAIAGELAEVRIGSTPALALKGAARRARGPAIRLLPAWDTYLMGYRDRGFMADPEGWRRIMPGGGLLYPTIVRDGVAVGTWRLGRTRGELRVELEPFADLDRPTLDALEAEAADVVRFEAKPAAPAGR